MWKGPSSATAGTHTKPACGNSSMVTCNKGISSQLTSSLGTPMLGMSLPRGGLCPSESQQSQLQWGMDKMSQYVVAREA